MIQQSASCYHLFTNMAGRDVCLRSSQIDRFNDNDGFLLSDLDSDIDVNDVNEQEDSSSEDVSESDKESEVEEVIEQLPQPVDLVLEIIE